METRDTEFMMVRTPSCFRRFWPRETPLPMETRDIESMIMLGLPSC